ncbi:hypothetical protein ACIBOV_28660 [Micromonospora chersina]|uniref:hypothetical protein n=1 Tax=Micromonospora chersina TaxID=47854 RepID=UPI0037B6803F
MFKNSWAGGWLLIGLVGSVLLRGALWLLTLLSYGPLLGPVDLMLIDVTDQTVGTAIWFGDIVASFLCAIATGVACGGLRRDHDWAYRLGRGLAWFYVAVSAATATACGVLMVTVSPSAWSLTDWSVVVGLPFVLYVVSIVVAVLALRQLAAHRPSHPAPSRSELDAVRDT